MNNAENHQADYNLTGISFKMNSEFKEFKNLKTQNATSNSSKEENNLRLQNVTANKISSKRRYNPYVYTEHGIIALAGVLKSDVVAKMSVEIVRKFIKMRDFIRDNSDTLLKLAELQNLQISFEIVTNKRFGRRIEKATPRWRWLVVFCLL